MEAKALNAPVAQLYDEDFAVWTEEMARLLRAGHLDEVDIEHVAEEIEDMGKSQRDEVLNRSTVLLFHLLKWKFQSEKRSGSWRATIRTQRDEIRRGLRTSPSLRRKLRESVAEVYQDALKRASDETGLPRRAFPAECPCTLDEILDPEFLPE